MDSPRLLALSLVEPGASLEEAVAALAEQLRQGGNKEPAAPVAANTDGEIVEYSATGRGWSVHGYARILSEPANEQRVQAEGVISRRYFHAVVDDNHMLRPDGPNAGGVSVACAGNAVHTVRELISIPEPVSSDDTIVFVNRGGCFFLTVKPEWLPVAPVIVDHINTAALLNPSLASCDANDNPPDVIAHLENFDIIRVCVPEQYQKVWRQYFGNLLGLEVTVTPPALIRYSLADQRLEVVGEVMGSGGVYPLGDMLAALQGRGEAVDVAGLARALIGFGYELGDVVDLLRRMADDDGIDVLFCFIAN